MAGYCTVITGAASGIGFSVAEKLLSSGRKIVAVDLNAERLQEKFAANEPVLCVSCDLTSADGLKFLCSEIKNAFDGVDGFVHAAGIDMMAPLGMVSSDSMQRLFAIHAVFPVQFLGWMSKKANHGPDSSAVLISSLSAHEGAKGHVAYAAAKGAVEGFLMPAAAELADKAIRLNAVVLGVIETEMSQKWIKKLTSEQYDSLCKDYPLGLGNPKDVAEAVSFLLSSSSRWVTGQRFIVDGGHMVA